MKITAALSFLFLATSALAGFQQIPLQVDNPKTKAFAVREDGPARWRVLVSDPYPSSGSTVPDFASESKATVAVNANFYSQDSVGIEKPIGLVVHEGALLSEPRPSWPSVGFWPDKADKNAKCEWDQVVLDGFAEALGSAGRVIRVHLCRLNGAASLGCAALWTNPGSAKRMKRKNLRKIFLEKSGLGPKLGASELHVVQDPQWVLELPQNFSKELLGKISMVKLDLKLRGKRLGEAWTSVREAVSGSHLISTSVSLPQATPASRGDRPWAQQFQPRTVLGQDAAGRVFVAAFDGRSTDSAGVSVEKAWQTVHEKLQAQWMLNLDGGGSTTLVYREKILNEPSSGLPRAVAIGFGAR